MRKTLKGYLVGFLSAAICFSGIAYAATGTKTIEVLYDNIKIYKDNVLCETRDANGKIVEPFVYNGTTYMPVRGTANLAGMDVTWDGKTKSVHLWDELVPDGTFLVDVCPPYDLAECAVVQATNGKSFSMAGEGYSNGIAFGSWSNGYALFNLNGKYSTLECTIGHTDVEQKEKEISFIVDGKVVKTITLEPECLPKKVSIPLNNGLQLKIQAGSPGYRIGVANITVK